MPRARKLKMVGGFYKDKTTGESHYYDIFVTEDGYFTASIPKDCPNEVRDIFQGAGISFYASSRDEVVRRVDEVITRYLSQQVTISRVIKVSVSQRSTGIKYGDNTPPEDWDSVYGGVKPAGSKTMPVIASSTDLKAERLFKVVRQGRESYFSYNFINLNFADSLKEQGYGNFSFSGPEALERAEKLEIEGKAIMDFNNCVPVFESEILDDYAFISKHLEKLNYMEKDPHIIIEEYSQETWNILQGLTERMLEVQIAIGKFLAPKKGLTLLETFQNRKTPFLGPADTHSKLHD